MNIRNSKFILTLAVLAASAFSAQAVIVQELGVQPNEIVAFNAPNVDGTGTFYNGYVYAGVVKLLVDGTPTDAFCIDPFHFSTSSPTPYDYVSLESAPKQLNGGLGMGTGKATTVSNLWTLNYSASMSAHDAAILQIAIWEVVSGLNLVNYYNSETAALITAANAYTGSTVRLIALTGSGQDYVVQAVPDGGSTLLLLGGTLLGLAYFGKRYSKTAVVQ